MTKKEIWTDTEVTDLELDMDDGLAYWNWDNLYTINKKLKNNYLAFISEHLRFHYGPGQRY